MGEFIVPPPIDAPQTPQEIPQEKGISLTTTPGLKEICEAISSAQPNMIYLKKRAQSFPRSNDRSYLKGLFSELHIQNVLQQVSLNTLNEGRLNLSPVETDTQTKNYTFEATPQGGIIAKSNHTNQTYAEYDTLIQIDDLPIVFEIKNIRRSEKRKLNAILYEKRLGQLFTPLQEQFDTAQFGYVVVTDQSSINPLSPNQQAFQERGGILIPASFPNLIHSGIIFDKDEAKC